MTYEKIAFILSTATILYILTLLQFMTQKDKNENKKQEQDNSIIIFEYQDNIYRYKTIKSFYRDIKELDTIKYFIKSNNEKQRLIEVINIYYPGSKILKIDV